MRCPECQSIVLINDERCRKCGKVLRASGAPKIADVLLAEARVAQERLRADARDGAKAVRTEIESGLGFSLDAIEAGAAEAAQEGLRPQKSQSSRSGHSPGASRDSAEPIAHGENTPAARVRMTSPPFFNALLAHAGVSLAPIIEITASRERLVHAKLHVTTSPLGPLTFAPRDLPDLVPDQPLKVTDLNLAWGIAALQDLPEATRGLWTAEVRSNDVIVGSATGEVMIQPLREWHASGEAADSIAGLITPNDPDVKAFVSKTGRSFSAYQSGSRQDVLQQVQALYEVIRNGGFRYIEPPPSFEGTGQKVRFPFELLRDRQGTCLDWCVLMAALLEYVGLHPMVVLMPGHAIHAVWLDNVEAPEAVLDADSYRTLIEDQMILPFNSTSYFDDGDTFAKATGLGIEMSGRVNRIIDIGNCRARGIRPLAIRG